MDVVLVIIVVRSFRRHGSAPTAALSHLSTWRPTAGPCLMACSDAVRPEDLIEHPKLVKLISSAIWMASRRWLWSWYGWNGTSWEARDGKSRLNWLIYARNERNCVKHADAISFVPGMVEFWREKMLILVRLMFFFVRPVDKSPSTHTSVIR